MTTTSMHLADVEHHLSASASITTELHTKAKAVDALEQSVIAACDGAPSSSAVGAALGIFDAWSANDDNLRSIWSELRRQGGSLNTSALSGLTGLEVPDGSYSPFDDAMFSLEQIRDILDTARQDRDDGWGEKDPDKIWSVNDLIAMSENEKGYYTSEQVAHAKKVLAMIEASPDAREYLGITESGGGWSLSDIGHLTLDLFGMVPIVGNAADGINAAWYAAEGKYLDAALSSMALLPVVGQGVTLAKPAIKAAANGRVFKSLDEAMAWAKQWLEARGIIKGADGGAGAARAGDDDFLYRGDSTPNSPQGRTPDRVKSHVDPETGDLIPANPSGNADIHHHVRGSEPSKSDSPFTSMSDNGDIASNYGDQTVRVDRTRLEADIAAGRVDGVEILSPTQVQDALQSRVDDAVTKFGNNPSPANQEKLVRAQQDLANATRDSEYLIRGTVPSDYVEVVSN